MRTIKFEQVINAFARIILREERLCAPYDQKCVQSWEWRNVTFQDHTKHRTMIPHLKLPKDNHQSLLKHQVSTQWNICGTKTNHPSLGSPSTMYPKREGGFEWSYRRPPWHEENCEHIFMLEKISQAIPIVCESELNIEGTQLFSIQQVQSITLERKRDFAPRQAWGKNILASRLRTHVLWALWQEGKFSLLFSYQHSIRGAKSHRLNYYCQLTLFRACVYLF